MNTDPTLEPVPFHLRGHFAPVSEERTATDLEVIGELPESLSGTYVRNGPNPRSGVSPIWFVGDGMLHGVRLERGRARWYRNRWIGGPYAPNTNVVRHAGRTLALVEARIPVEVDAELGTVGPFDFGGGLPRSMTAHPKSCPATGELLLFSYGLEDPRLVFYRADAEGRIVHRAEVEVPAATYLHDFGITERFAVFYDLPVLFGGWRSPEPLRWSDDYSARIGVLPRDGRGDEVRWFPVAPCSVAHVVNAYEDGDQVVLDVVRAPRFMAAHALWRYTLDLRSGDVTEREICARFLDFPRVNPQREGRPYRFATTVELTGFVDGGPTFSAAHRVDVETGRLATHDFGPGRSPGEAVLIPRGEAEDDAWAMLLVHEDDGAELVVLDAARFEAEPVARVRIPFRVPFGFHGAWLPE